MRNVAIPLPQLGIDLLTDETSLPKGAVREAINVDLKKSGAFARRPGFSTRVAGDGFTGIFADERGVLVGRGTKVYALDADTYTPTMLCDLGREAPVDFTKYNGHVYFTNPGSSWWVPSDSAAARPVGVALPDRLPTVADHTAGALLPGEYSVALSIVDERGEESQSCLLGTLMLTAGVMLSGLEQAPGRKYRVYLTPPGGDVLYLAAEFDAVFEQYAVTVLPAGAVRTSQYLRPMPAGDFIRGHAGRLYVASEDTIFYSEPLRPHLCDPRHNFIKFVGKVRFMEPLPDGMYVGDDRGTWWLAGDDPTKYQLVRAHESLAIRRSSVLIPGRHLPSESMSADKNVVVWLSTMGYMAGREGGVVVPLNPERVAVAADLEGRSVFLLRDGMKQIITLTAAPTSAIRTFGVALDTSLQ